jgi:superfamily II DNA or RNA helicase
MMQAKIVIKDECNIKIEGLELDIRRALMKKFEFEIPGARYLPSVRLGRWNGKVSYFSLAGSTYLNLLDQIIPILDDYGYDIELDDHRQSHPDFNFELVKEDSFSNYVWPAGHMAAGQPIMLRDYQVEIINTFLSNPQSLNEVATGAGKTLMTAALSRSVEKYGKSIIIVPNKSLVGQTETDYINLGLDVGVYFGDRKDYGKQHTICTWQSLNNLLKRTKEGESDPEIIKSFFDDVICVLVDECHQVKADVLKTLLTGVLSHVPIRWGLTGTIPTAAMDQASLLVSLGPVVSKLAASDLQERGVLASCHVNIIQMKDSKEFSNYQSELKFLLEDDNRLNKISEVIQKISQTGNTLVLLDRVGAGKELVSRMPDSVFVSGETKLSERKEEYDEIATSVNKIIVATYGVAAVGINLPRIFNLVLIEPGKSFVRVIQSIGRGIRKADDKDSVMIWDITSTCKFAKRHLTQRKAFYKEASYPFSLEKLDY